MNFQYIKDKKYFIDFLAKGDKDIFDNDFAKYFDFRDPKIKRVEFNITRKEVYQKLVKKYGEVCQLRLCADCSVIKKFDVDHFIPLSTNELNKKIRGLKPQNGKKVPSQSFGSNDISNLRIACKRCNAYKKHRILW